MNDEVMHFFYGKPTLLGEILEEYLKEEGLDEPIRNHQLVGLFSEIFPNLKKFCQCEGYRNGVLFLSLADPIFSHEVQKFIPEICKIYQEKGLMVKKVKIRGIGKK
ncbi:MAG: DUF721 domain-containing protein [Candidatus Atribacteria bacterium]|nr:DUF721 domain-containing protein [Candidatus Atribacteria bacterium]